MRLTSARLLRYACAVLGLLLADALPAADPARRQLDAHAHGEGILEVAVDGHELLAAFRIPAANVVGFEHAPANEEQRRKVEAARQRFLDGAGLLVPSAAAACRLEGADVTLGGEAHEGAPAHRTGTHDRTPETAGQHGHVTQPGHPAPAEGDAHSELAAEYHFRCDQPGELGEIEVRLLGALLDVHAVEAHVVTPGYQGAVKLTPGQTTLKLRP